MSKFEKILSVFLFVLLVSVVAGRFSGLYSRNTEDAYSEVRQNIYIFGQLYKEVANRYVEAVDPEKFMRAGIQGMLDQLDPYTVYLEPDGRDELQIMTRGKYYGVGMRITTRNGWPTVAEQPFPNSPAALTGIREGDQIIKIDGRTTQDDNLSETAKRLRDTKKGSEVTIEIRRVGEDKPLEFTLVRDEIVVPDIEYTGFVEPGIGVIKLSRFNRGAGEQIQDALEDLLNRGMKALIFDLRQDPGGLLDVAVSVADNFLPRGELIVYTEGRWEKTKQEYRAQTNPIIGNMPMVVLVDGLSASASEIVAGAIQDLDRGVIIGSRTFGKGLVQTVLPLDRRGEHQLKMTTAQYYIPSGRLIQRPEVFNRGANSVLIESEAEQDSVQNNEEQTFYTKNGRPVKGGGGINPDIVVENRRVNRYFIELIRRSMFFNFSLDYLSTHPDIAEDFQVDEEIMDLFFDFVKAKEFDYEPEGYDELNELERIAEENGFDDPIAQAIDSIRREFDNVKEKERLASLDFIKSRLQRELAAKAFGSAVAIETTFKSDSAVVKAVEVLKDQEKYGKILNSSLALRE